MMMEFDQIRLNAEESKRFNEMLENPPEPSNGLKVAMAKYKARRKPLAILRFVHDLEDGWYVLDEPNNKCSYWSWASQAQLHCSNEGWDLAYVGDPQYKPVGIAQAPSRTYTLS